MKNTFMAVFTIVLTAPIFAQIPKGTSTIGGNLSLLRSKTQLTYETLSPNIKTENTTKMISIIPTYGYFVVNNLCVGVNINTSFSRTTSQPYYNLRGTHNDSQSIAAGPMVRYYLPLDSKLYLFGTASYSWRRTHYSDEFYTNNNTEIKKDEYKLNSTLWDAGLGLSFFINPSTAVEAGVIFSRAHNKNDEPYTAQQKTNRLAFNIGFRIFLQKR